MERRKGSIVLNVIQTVVNATFLLLAVLLISDRWSSLDTTDKLIAAKKEMQDTMQSNFTYLENKANRVAESSDSYQVNTNSRITVLENRMRMLEERRYHASRITNSNTNVVNGAVKPAEQQ